MKRAMLIGLLGAVLALAGCSDDEGGDSASAAESEGTQQQNDQGGPSGEAQEASGPATPTADQVPVPEDYADETKKEITKDNYEKKLDELAQQIEKPDGGS